MDARRISLVVPVLNEAAGIVSALQALAPLRGRGHEVIVVDGGSEATGYSLSHRLPFNG